MLFLGLTISPLFLIVAVVLSLAPSEPMFIPRDEEGRRCCPVCKTRHYLVFPTRQRTAFGMSWITGFGRNQVEYRCQDCYTSWREAE
jgi:hypothetical protein